MHRRASLRRAAVLLFGEELVSSAESVPDLAPLPLHTLARLTALARSWAPRGYAAWSLALRTYVLDLPMPQRLAAVRLIAQGAQVQ